ncbi:hypothetical protein [Entomohabitans teleogrylli]|uniref:hypothetical protein n=1 Tax=Entomohabitans teleogrylli TaxID=1384589 RepID=UPI00073D4CC0|nr:hypothetical protein [Entomohabitans teleogrylli]
MKSHQFISPYIKPIIMGDESEDVTGMILTAEVDVVAPVSRLACQETGGDGGSKTGAVWVMAGADVADIKCD